MSTLVNETFTGTNGDAWNATNWTQMSATGSPTSLADIQSNAGRMLAQGGSYTRIAMGSNQAATTDTGLLFSVTLGATGEQYPIFMLRGNGTWGTSKQENCVYFMFLPDSGLVEFAKVIAYTPTYLSGSFGGWTPTTAKQWVRMEFVGTTINVKWWLDGNSEPGWLLTDTVSDTELASGQVYLSFTKGPGGDLTATFDDLTIYDFTSPPVDATAAGSSATSGTVAATVEHVVTAAGSSSTSGTVTAIPTVNATAAGSSATSATVTAIPEHSAIAASSSVTSGTVTATVESAAIATGSSATSGTATATTEHTATAAGSSSTSGTATAASTVDVIAAGTSATSGAAIADVLTPVLAIGSSTSASSGTATAIVTVTVIAAGTSTTSGTVTATAELTVTAAGSSATSGVAVTVVTHLVIAAGTSATSGTATAGVPPIVTGPLTTSSPDLNRTTMTIADDRTTTSTTADRTMVDA